MILALLSLMTTPVLAAPSPTPSPSPTTDKITVVLTKDNTVTLNDVVYPDTVAKVVQQAKLLDGILVSTDPIYLVLHTPGGSIDDGLELIENLKSLRRPVITINLFSASMGFQIAQGLGTRLVTSDGTLMSHKARGGFYGEFPGQLDSRYQYYLKRILRLDEIAVKRTNGKHTVTSYHNLIENEFWCDGQDCVKEGFADALVKVSCDKSLDGIHTEKDRFVYMGHLIEIAFDYSNCPTNTNSLGQHLSIDGQPLWETGAKGPANDWFTFSTLSSQNTNIKLDSEVLTLIKEKIEERVSKRNSKSVIRSY